MRDEYEMLKLKFILIIMRKSGKERFEENKTENINYKTWTKCCLKYVAIWTMECLIMPQFM